MESIYVGTLEMFIKEVKLKGMHHDAIPLLERLIQNNRSKGNPCRDRVECLATGRCPEDPVCNN